MATLTDGAEPSVTVKTVAARAGVSAQTVSRVLRGTGYVSDETREKVLAAVQAVGYRPNAVGRSLRATRTPMVGLLITDITNPFYVSLHKSIEAVFRKRGLTLMLLNSDDDRETERQQLELVSSYRPSGLLVAPAVRSSLTTEDLAAFGNSVLVSRTLPGLCVPSVVTNESEAMGEATQALLDAGHRRIVASLGPAAASTTKRRESGYRSAMAAHAAGHGSGVGDPEVIEPGLATGGESDDHLTEQGLCFLESPVVAGLAEHGGKHAE
jgi:LacI family transcriptional regulator